MTILSVIFHYDGLALTNHIEHSIRTMDEIPFYSKIDRYPFVHKKVVQKQVDDTLKQNKLFVQVTLLGHHGFESYNKSR